MKKEYKMKEEYKKAKKLYQDFKNIYKLPNGKDIRDIIKELKEKEWSE